MTKKLIEVMILILLTLSWSCSNEGDTKKDQPKKVIAKAEIAADFTMIGSWTSDYKDQKIKITLNEGNKGELVIADKTITLLKWDEERSSKSRINIGLYFYSRDSDHFVKKTLRMYNPGFGLKLKAVYLGANKLQLYNGLYLHDGMFAKDDGRMELNR
ncbi:MAG: hypothetical protein GY714_11295 [Desulfobacterales bacterium]|nr:hypothetical protein [Desulfobacterales bacterium]MCP4162475.1 hypothetical protein [Deltaproteobacteria bacterium]